MLPKETDDRIVALLSQNADVSYKEMARKLRLNESTVRKRVLALKKRGIIKRFLVDVDAEKLGYKTRVMLGVDADPARMMEVGKTLQALPEVRMLFNTSGGHDFQAVVWASDRDSFSKLLKEISATIGVVKVVPSFMVERLK